MAGAPEAAAPRVSKLDPFKPVIDEILKADLDAPHKQRHTVTRIWHRLMDEHGMADVSYPVVRAYVAERSRRSGWRPGRGPDEAFVPRSHRPGTRRKPTFGEVVVRLAGEDVGCFLFCRRLFGIPWARSSPNSAFLDCCHTAMGKPAVGALRDITVIMMGDPCSYGGDRPI